MVRLLRKQGAAGEACDRTGPQHQGEPELGHTGATGERLKRASLNSLIAANGAGMLDGMSATTRQAAAKPIKVGTWRRDFAGLQERRMEAARMFAHGATQAEVARTFGVSPQAASIWYRRWRQGGEPALRGAGRAGRRPRLSQAELEAVDQALGKGPEAFGFDTDLWTLARVAAVIERLTGVAYHPGHVWRLLRRLGWSLQRPARRARERDEAAIARWRAQEWPRIKGGR
jgi:transposase